MKSAAIKRITPIRRDNIASTDLKIPDTFPLSKISEITVSSIIVIRHISSSASMGKKKKHSASTPYIPTVERNTCIDAVTVAAASDST